MTLQTENNRLSSLNSSSSHSFSYFISGVILKLSQQTQAKFHFTGAFTQQIHRTLESDTASYAIFSNLKELIIALLATCASSIWIIIALGSTHA